MLREHGTALFTCFLEKEPKSFKKRQNRPKSYKIDFDGKSSILGLVCQLGMVFLCPFEGKLSRLRCYLDMAVMAKAVGVGLY